MRLQMVLPILKMIQRPIIGKSITCLHCKRPEPYRIESSSFRIAVIPRSVHIKGASQCLPPKEVIGGMEGKANAFAVLSEIAMDVKFIVKGRGISHSRLLFGDYGARHGILTGLFRFGITQCPEVIRNGLEPGIVDFLYQFIPIDYFRQRDFLSIIRPEHRGQIAAYGSSPGTDIAFFYFLSGFFGKKLLQKHDGGSDVADFRIDPTSPAPGRSHHQRHPEAQAYRALPRTLGGKTGLDLLFHRNELSFYAYSRRNLSLAFIIRIWWHKRRDVIKITIIFIVIEDKDGLLPYFRILRQNIQYLRHIPGPVPRRTGVIGKPLGCHQPGDGREFATVHVLTEVV